MAWVGQHRGRGTPTQERARRSRKAETIAERRARLIAERKCVRCAERNDRAGKLSKNGRRAVVCSCCLERANGEREAARESAKALIMDMERALGMPMLGVGGRNIR